MLADVPQPLLVGTGILTWNQPHVGADLLATRKSRWSSDDQYVGEGRQRTYAGMLAGLAVWIIYVGLMGYFGVVRNTTIRPPGIAFILVPLVFFFVFFIGFILRSSGARVALAFPLWIILSTQTFRTGVELFLHQLWIAGLIPKMLTFSGANVDI